MGLADPGGDAAAERQLGPDYHGAVIGPAGEHCVRFATISHGNRHAGRGGHGAVLGSKLLKAVMVSGTQRVPVADPAGVVEAARDLSQRSFGPATAKYRELGTVANLLTFNRLHALPTRNFQARPVRGGGCPFGRSAERRARGSPATPAPPAPLVANISTLMPRGRYGWNMRAFSLWAPCAASAIANWFCEPPISATNWALTRYPQARQWLSRWSAPERGLLTPLGSPGLRFGNGDMLLVLLPNDWPPRIRVGRSSGRRLAASGRANRRRLGRFRAARQGLGAARLRATDTADNGPGLRSRLARGRSQPERRLRSRLLRQGQPLARLPRSGRAGR